MPTIMTHALLPLIAAAALPRPFVSSRLVAACMVAAMLPDADVVSRLFGIPHWHDFGHRGATHTVLFALLVGAAGTLAARSLRASGAAAFWFLFASTLSHALTDMLTTGGKGIMIFWPADHSRMKFLFHPVEVSPIGLRGFETGRIWEVLLSEAIWLWVPAALLAFLARLALKSKPLARAAD
jgi:inner membrane protein